MVDGDEQPPPSALLGKEGSTAPVAQRLAAVERWQRDGAVPTETELRELSRSLGDGAKIVQKGAALALARLAARGTASRPLLERMLDEGSACDRWGAAYALSLQGEVPEAALPVLLEGLAAADGDLRWAACDILVRGTGAWRRGAAEALVALAVNGGVRQRKMALYALRDLDWRGDDSEGAARRALAESDCDLRLAGMATLARLGRDRAAAARDIAVYLRDGQERVRRAAAGTLGMLGCEDPEVLAALREAAADADESTARAARRALQRLRA